MSGGSKKDRRVRPGVVGLCVDRASMRTLLAGDTHAAPPRGQMYIYQHVVRVCYLTYVACAIPLASARLLWGIGSGLPSRVSASPLSLYHTTSFLGARAGVWLVHSSSS